MTKSLDIPTEIVSLKSVRIFAQENPTFSEGSLRWMIFKLRKELISAHAIGSRVLINPPNLCKFILEGKAKH
jgi:DNA-binding SARP family transcriptional activator